MTRLLLALAVVSLPAIATGCGASSALHDGGAAGSGSGGSAGAGSGGAAGSGSGGAAGAPATCPALPPASGASCSGAQSCFYEDCTDTGRTVARCANGAWSLETGACTAVICQAQTCPIGQVCVQRIGGALIVECAQNTCGVGAIGCSCLQSCLGDCTVGGSLQSGVTIQCNTCPTNTCP